MLACSFEDPRGRFWLAKPSGRLEKGSGQRACLLANNRSSPLPSFRWGQSKALNNSQTHWEYRKLGSGLSFQKHVCNYTAEPAWSGRFYHNWDQEVATRAPIPEKSCLYCPRSTSQNGLPRPRAFPHRAPLAESGSHPHPETREAGKWRGVVCLILLKTKCEDGLQEIWEPEPSAGLFAHQ